MRRGESCRIRGLSFSTLDRHLKKQRWKRKKTRAAEGVQSGKRRAGLIGVDPGNHGKRRCTLVYFHVYVSFVSAFSTIPSRVRTEAISPLGRNVFSLG